MRKASTESRSYLSASIRPRRVLPNTESSAAFLNRNGGYKDGRVVGMNKPPIKPSPDSSGRAGGLFIPTNQRNANRLGKCTCAPDSAKLSRLEFGTRIASVRLESLRTSPCKSRPFQI